MLATHTNIVEYLAHSEHNASFMVEHNYPNP